jgi:hypothetical protein
MKAAAVNNHLIVFIRNPLLMPWTSETTSLSSLCSGGAFFHGVLKAADLQVYVRDADMFRDHGPSESVAALPRIPHRPLPKTKRPRTIIARRELLRFDRLQDRPLVAGLFEIGDSIGRAPSASRSCPA